MSCDDGSFISGSEDKTIRIWDLRTKNCATLKGHGGLVKCVAALHDGRRIVSGSKDQSLKIWDLVTLQCCMTLKGHTALVWRLAVASDDSFVVSASKDDMLRVSTEFKLMLKKHFPSAQVILLSVGPNFTTMYCKHSTPTEYFSALRLKTIRFSITNNFI